MLTADMGGADDVPMVSPLVSGAIDEAQNQVQSFFFGIRKDVFKYDEVLDQQRQVVYGVRRKALLDSDEGVLDSLRSYCTESMTELVEQLISPSQPLDSWPLERMATKLSAWFTGTLSVTPEDLRAVAGAGGEEGCEALRCWVQRETLEAIDRKAARIDEDAPQLHRAVFRQVLLMQIDNYWRKHLKYMTFLRNYSKLRSYGQRDPLVEYKLDGYKAFQVMMGKIRRDTVYYLFTFQPRRSFCETSPMDKSTGTLKGTLERSLGRHAMLGALLLLGAVKGDSANRRCDLPRISAQDLTWDDFASKWRGKPVLVTHLNLEVDAPTEPAAFAKRFGAEVVQISDGRNEEGARRHRSMKLAKYLSRPAKYRFESRHSLPTIFLSDLCFQASRGCSTLFWLQ
ncbi:secA [Symbiodinium microadriaticum]|nr:secA [Symbiodinium microadriaticum]CAE7941557.1 secA [Symbiodinium sp. KB8]